MTDPMTHDAEQPPRRNPWRQAAWMLGGFAVLMLILFLLFRWSLHRSVEAELAAIRDAGYPVTAEELDEWYEDVPADENAALVLTDAFGWMRIPQDGETLRNLPLVGDAELPEPTKPLPAEQVAAMEALLEENAEALELLHEGAAMERSRYPVDLSAGFSASGIRFLSTHRAAANLLGVEALWHAEQGRAEEAARSVRAMLGLAASFENEPVLISQLVHVAIESLAVEELERAVHQVELDDAALAGLIDDLADAEHPSAAKRGMIGERAIANHMFMEGDMGTGLGPVFFIYRLTGVAQLDHLTYLDVVGEYVAALEQPPHERIATTKAATAKANDLPVYAVLTKIMLSSSDAAARVELLALAHLRTAGTALAIERYRLAHGELPDDLAALTPDFINDLPPDPFTGDPLKYKKSDDGYTVYSVGLDQTDDGGVPPSGRDQFEPGSDVPFTVER